MMKMIVLSLAIGCASAFQAPAFTLTPRSAPARCSVRMSAGKQGASPVGLSLSGLAVAAALLGQPLLPADASVNSQVRR